MSSERLSRDRVPAHGVPPPLRRASDLAWRFLVVGAAVVVVAILLARLRLVFVPAAIALLLTCALWPVVVRLRRLGVPKGIAAAVVILLLLGTVAAAIALVAPRVAGHLDELDLSVSGGVDRIQRWLTDGPLDLSDERVASLFDRAEQQLRSSAGEIAAGGVFGSAMLALEVIAGVLLTLVLAFFFLKDGDELWAWTGRTVLSRWQGVIDAGPRVRTVLGRFVYGQALIAMIDAVGIGVGLWLLDVPLALPLALLTFFGGFVPFVGASVAGFAAIMVALVADGFVKALLVFGLVLAVQQLESNLLQPVIVGHTVRLHPVAVLLAVTAGTVLWGIVGAFLAVPILAALIAAWNPEGIQDRD